MELDKYEKALYYEIFVSKEYQILDDFIKKSGTIFDIGWHIGFFTNYCHSINNKANIHYFEPVPKLFEKWKKIIGENKNIILNNKWVWTTTSKQKIFVNSTKTMQSSIYTNNFLNKEQKSHLCDFISLEKYLQENNINYIDLCKIDIEWAEIKVLEEISTETLQKINVLFFEYHILFENDSQILQKILHKLDQNFKKTESFRSKYTENIWYVLCY